MYSSLFIKARDRFPEEQNTLHIIRLPPPKLRFEKNIGSFRKSVPYGIWKLSMDGPDGYHSCQFAIIQAWEAMQEDILKQLARRMPKRLPELAESHGGSTRY